MRAYESDPSDLDAGLVVIGSGPAGHSAAVAYRAAGGGGRVVMVTADDAAPYERPPLSKDYLRGETEEQALFQELPTFYAEQRIELFLGDPVVTLDPGRALLVTDSGRSISFSRCVIATGCVPVPLPVPGADHPGLFVLRSLTHARALRAAAERAGSAVIIGSGFIGCEAAVSLAIRGLTVTMVSAEERPQLRRLGGSVADRLTEWLADAGVHLLSGVEVAEIRNGTTVVTSDGRAVDGDLVLVAAGAKPNSQLAEQAGLRVEDGRIVVDGNMATNCPGIYAAGDAAVARNGAAGRALPVEHWGEGLRMGEVAGTSAAGGSDEWADVPGFWSEIGKRTLKYAAWGDGFERHDLVSHPNGGFTAWYFNGGTIVGVLTHDADDDYERGRELIRNAAG